MKFFTKKLPVYFCLILVLAFKPIYAQNVLDDIDEEERVDTPSNSEVAPNLATETIKNISASKKIFILTNENLFFSKGDFITLLLANKLVCRALVAKTTAEKLSGIKIIKIYNITQWKLLAESKEVQVLKGDDSYYTNKEKAPVKEKDATDKKNNSKIQSDEDLFNTSSANGTEDDLSLEENNKRLIKPDNLFALNVGLIKGVDVDSSKKNYTQLNAAWAYQLNDNIWAEIMLGSNTVTDFPYTGIDTRLINIDVKAKYTINAPLYSYIQPYLGYQTILANSPGAGVPAEDNSRSAEQLAEELKLVQNMRKSSVIFGVTVLKRIVPGWFARVDLGTDIINGGLAIEF